MVDSWRGKMVSISGGGSRLEDFILVDFSGVGAVLQQVKEIEVSQEYADRQPKADNWSACPEKLGYVVAIPWPAIERMYLAEDRRHAFKGE